MILKYTIPQRVNDLISLRADERIYYAVPFDISREAAYTDDSYLVVTTQRVLVFTQGELSGSYDIKDISAARAVPRVGGGFLTVTSGEQERILVHYSAKHLSRYAYIARGINILVSGRFEEVESREYERTCPVCGRAIPGTRNCPKCSKEGGFLKSFVKMAGPYKKNFFGIFILMILAAITTLLNPEIQKHLINDVLKGNGGMKKALFFIMMMFSLSVGIVIVNVLKSNASAKLGAKISADLRSKLFRKYQELPISFINDRRPGELLNRITNDTQYIRMFMEDVFCNLFAVLFIFIWDVVFMMALNLKLSLITFAFIPLAIFLTVAFRKTVSRIFRLQFRKNDDVASDLQDVLSGMRVVKTYGKEKEESEKFKRLSAEYARINRRNETFWAYFSPLLQMVMGLGVLAVVLFGGMDVLGDRMSPGELYQFVTYTSLLFQYISWMNRLPLQLAQLAACLDRINDILGQDVEAQDENKVQDIDIKGEVTFDHATFGYKSYQPILEDLSVTVKPGEMIGIVGASGAGKSTLINLLMGLYDVDDGRILIDGHDKKTIRSSSYHSQIGVVLQETFLFSGTILENIRFSKPDAT
ncbi:MAG: ABC transporter ATP-binding protein, partial [Lachnospiraceae bacterium]|nr:ABC transporter ATP-binding protein [Lachnospiraceae bacterium]